MLERARARDAQIDYRIADATSEAQLLALGEEGSFDVGVCNMAIMDIPKIEPLAAALRRLLRPGGRFVFSILHPAFNGSGTARVVEEVDDERGVRLLHSVKVSRYIRPRVSRGMALAGQPEAQWYFDRPISALLGTFFERGFVLDGLEEPVFEPSQVDAGSTVAVFVELPAVLVARLRA
jgi:SAM-dependent methyltransferase